MDITGIKFNIYVLGAGGTGTYFIKEFSRYIASLKNPPVADRMFVMDGDTVEKKNLDRQAFLPEDVGFKKSSVIADVINHTLFEDGNMEWVSVPSYLTDLSQLSIIPTSTMEATAEWFERRNHCLNIPFIFSCVDNHAARLLLEEYFNSQVNCILFDSANEFDNGECVFAAKMGGKVIAPVRSHYFPDIKTGDLRPVTEMSCTELNTVAPQHIFTNMYAALQLLTQAAKLIEDGSFSGGYSSFNSKGLMNNLYPYTIK